MERNTDLRPLLGVLLIASLVLLVVNAVLYSIAYARKGGHSQGVDKFDTAAMILGLIGTIVWTVVLWPVMTGSSRGAYVVRVNGVVTGGGLVDVMHGLVPFFVVGVALMALPRALGYGIWRLRSNVAASKGGEGKPSVVVLALSVLSIIAGIIFVGTVVSFVSTPGSKVSPVGATISACIGVVFIALGVWGIVRFVSRSRR